MIRKIIYISIFAFLLQTSPVVAGSTGSEELKDSNSQEQLEVNALKVSVEQCFHLIMV